GVVREMGLVVEDRELTVGMYPAQREELARDSFGDRHRVSRGLPRDADEDRRFAVGRRPGEVLANDGVNFCHVAERDWYTTLSLDDDASERLRGSSLPVADGQYELVLVAHLSDGGDRVARANRRFDRSEIETMTNERVRIERERVLADLCAVQLHPVDARHRA